MVMALLCTSGLAAAYFLWTIEQRSQASVTTQTAISARLARMSETISDIGAAQQSYVAPGQLDEPWFERTSTLIDNLSADTERARTRPRSRQAADALRALTASIDALMVADARTRQNLRLGQELMAADVIFSDGRNILDAMTARLRDLHAAEQASHLAELAALSRGRWIALGATALLWVAGLLALAMMPASTPASTIPASIGAPAAARPPVEVAPLVSAAASFEQPSRLEFAFAAAADTQRVSPDLASAASLCTDLARATTVAALPDLLARAARVLDASGLIVWMSAGHQIFPVLGHGYRPDTLARLGPIAHDADNAAAEAWRTGQLTLVQAAGATGHGAIVAPLPGLHACIGVLAAEVRHGAESNPGTQAVTIMIAAQLATLVQAWPAAGLTLAGGTTNGVVPKPAPGEAARAVRSA